MSQVPELPRWVVVVLVLFVVFFVLASPETAGAQVRAFFDLIGDLISAAATFFSTLFTGEPA